MFFVTGHFRVFLKERCIETMKTFTLKKRLDVAISSDLRDFIAEEADRTGKPMNIVTDELLGRAVAHRRGEVIEQQSLPIIREIVQSELRKSLAQLLIDLREALLVELLNGIKETMRASDNRIVSLLVRVMRDAGIARRMIYALISKLVSTTFAAQAFEDAREKTGKDIANRQNKEGEVPE
jgi:hypothetical protein